MLSITSLTAIGFLGQALLVSGKDLEWQFTSCGEKVQDTFDWYNFVIQQQSQDTWERGFTEEPVNPGKIELAIIWYRYSHVNPCPWVMQLQDHRKVYGCFSSNAATCPKLTVHWTLRISDCKPLLEKQAAITPILRTQKQMANSGHKLSPGLIHNSA